MNEKILLVLVIFSFCWSSLVGNREDYIELVVGVARCVRSFDASFVIFVMFLMNFISRRKIATCVDLYPATLWGLTNIRSCLQRILFWGSPSLYSGKEGTGLLSAYKCILKLCRDAFILCHSVSVIRVLNRDQTARVTSRVLGDAHRYMNIYSVIWQKAASVIEGRVSIAASVRFSGVGTCRRAHLAALLLRLVVEECIKYLQTVVAEPLFVSDIRTAQTWNEINRSAISAAGKHALNMIIRRIN